MYMHMKSFSNKPTTLSTGFTLCCVFHKTSTVHLFCSKETTEKELSEMNFRQSTLPVRERGWISGPFCKVLVHSTVLSNVYYSYSFRNFTAVKYFSFHPNFLYSFFFQFPSLFKCTLESNLRELNFNQQEVNILNAISARYYTKVFVFIEI